MNGFTEEEKITNFLNDKSINELNNVYKKLVNEKDNKQYIVSKIKNIKYNMNNMKDEYYLKLLRQYPLDFAKEDMTGTRFSMFANDFYKILMSNTVGEGVYFGRLDYSSKEYKMSIPFTIRFKQEENQNRKFILESAKPIQVGWDNFKIYSINQKGERCLLLEFRMRNFEELPKTIKGFLRTVYTD